MGNNHVKARYPILCPAYVSIKLFYMCVRHYQHIIKINGSIKYVHVCNNK